MALLPLFDGKGARKPAAAGLMLAVLTGCQSFSAPASLARVRIVDLSSDAGPVDVYQGGGAVAYNLSYGTVTSYVPMTPGTYTMTIDLAGSKQVLSTTKATFKEGAQYTLLVNNPVASLQQTILADQVPATANGTPSIRFINQALRAGPIDVYLVPAGQRLTSVAPVITNLAPGANTAYLPAPNGICTAVLLPAGTIVTATTIPSYSGTQINYESGSARSVVLLDAQPLLAPGLQIIATIDAEPVN